MAPDNRRESGATKGAGTWGCAVWQPPSSLPRPNINVWTGPAYFLGSKHPRPGQAATPMSRPGRIRRYGAWDATPASADPFVALFDPHIGYWAVCLSH